MLLMLPLFLTCTYQRSILERIIPNGFSSVARRRYSISTPISCIGTVQNQINELRGIFIWKDFCHTIAQVNIEIGSEKRENISNIFIISLSKHDVVSCREIFHVEMSV